MTLPALDSPDDDRRVLWRSDPDGLDALGKYGRADPDELPADAVETVVDLHG